MTLTTIALSTTSLYAGVLGFVLVVLSLGVVRARLDHEVSLGDGGIGQLLLAQRRQGNFVEYVPYAIVLLALLEAAGTSAWMLHTLGLSLVIARVIHPIGLAAEFGLRAPRVIGSVVTWVGLAWMSGLLIYNAIVANG